MWRRADFPKVGHAFDCYPKKRFSSAILEANAIQSGEEKCYPYDTDATTHICSTLYDPERITIESIPNYKNVERILNTPLLNGISFRIIRIVRLLFLFFASQYYILLQISGIPNDVHTV